MNLRLNTKIFLDWFIFMELIFIMGYPSDFLDRERGWLEEKRKDDDRKFSGFLANGKRYRRAGNHK